MHFPHSILTSTDMVSLVKRCVNMTKDLLLWDQTIFKEQEYFELDFLPENLLHRDAQMRSLKFSIAPALRGSTPLNAYCRGAPGTGKTSAVTKIFAELESATQKVVPVYINCQVDSSRYAIFAQIFKKLSGYPPRPPAFPSRSCSPR